MKRMATLLSIAATIMIAACAMDRFGPIVPGDSVESKVYDNAYNRYACRSYNYDPRSCH